MFYLNQESIEIAICFQDRYKSIYNYANYIIIVDQIKNHNTQLVITWRKFN